MATQLKVALQVCNMQFVRNSKSIMRITRKRAIMRHFSSA